jgi:hypothetical protein
VNAILILALVAASDGTSVPTFAARTETGHLVTVRLARPDAEAPRIAHHYGRLPATFDVPAVAVQPPIPAVYQWWIGEQDRLIAELRRTIDVLTDERDLALAEAGLRDTAEVSL